LTPDKIKKLLMFLVPIAIICIAAGIFLFDRNNELTTVGPQGEIAQGETDSAKWAAFYPVHWDSYQTNLENDAKPSHFEGREYLQTIYAGFGFAKEYNEPRSHLYTIEDVKAIDPARKKAGASCITCKSTQVPALMEKYGADYYLMSFDEIIGEVTEPIGCLDCHDPQTMELRLSRPALIEALERQGRISTRLLPRKCAVWYVPNVMLRIILNRAAKRLFFPGIKERRRSRSWHITMKKISANGPMRTQVPAWSNRAMLNMRLLWAVPIRQQACPVQTAICLIPKSAIKKSVRMNGKAL
jgi:nitrite reductase (cytochrome c-552)